MKTRLIHLLAICLLTSIGLYFHYNKLTDFPRYHHAWAQSDHLALSLGFLDNRFDFFHPQTFHYNPSFPEWWLTPNETTITAVDFPINNYVVAIFMKLLNTRSPGVFRIYLLIYSIIGLFFFFKFSREIGNSNVISFLLLLIASTSPVFIYYQAGFLPSIPCAANTLIALYFLVVYVKTKNKTAYATMILFFTLATLSRTSYAVPLIALLCFESYNLVIRKQKDIYKWGLLGLSALLIVGYTFYNSYLRSEYGSIFLSEPRPPESVKHFLEIVRNVHKTWSEHYFNGILSWLFLLIPIIPLINHFFTKSDKVKPPAGIWFYYSIWVFGSLCFAVLMIIQFLNHDYYFIDTLFLPLLVGLSISLSYLKLPEFRFSGIVYSLLIVAISIPLLSHAKSIISHRDEDNAYDVITPVTDNFTGSKELLDSLGIAKDAKILVLESVTPNIPFILMDRKGYTSMRMEKDALNKLIRWDYDYVIIQNEVYVAKTQRLIPESLAHLDRVAGNRALTICTYSPVSIPKSLKNLLGLESKKEIAHFYQNFEQGDFDPWRVEIYDTSFVYEGKYCAVVPYNYTYGLEFKIQLKDLPEVPTAVLINGFMNKYSDLECDMALVVHEGENLIHTRNYSLNNLVDQQEWQAFNLYYSLPDKMPANTEITLYVYNTGGNHVFFDDLRISLY